MTHCPPSAIAVTTDVRVHSAVPCKTVATDASESTSRERNHGGVDCLLIDGDEERAICFSKGIDDLT